ncbi:YbaB/EbfC family nucleoid-associated protein [Nocardioides sp. Y6]|uniref:Nucleoid-associated protein IEQ44_05195 n=1 Tax=Nocardioides malaquae TaxID=2773426 RepID=A0ABR9RR44_9ACTN|nr:YbaB/EbfC family nucleoid-associated protein [Nocardioides malaquae]MBE7324044.1 YbaB/EbfC family nucleoid-associated protein [Nocardioides malaquae]
MSQNPFEGLGGAGGFDMNALLAQAQQLQSQMEEAQARLQSQKFTGASGGVSVEVTGSGDLAGVTITPGTFDGSSSEDLEDLGDLLVAAYRDAKAKADAEAQAVLGPIAGGAAGGGFPGLG